MALPAVVGIVRRERASFLHRLVELTSVLGRLLHRATDRASQPSGTAALLPTRLRPSATRRWRDAHAAPPGAFSARAVPDAALTAEGVPGSRDGWDEVFDFALSYDGHAYWDGLSHLAARVHAAWTRDESLPGDLGQLRACLFHEQRRWHHLGNEPMDRSARYIRALVESIRHVVVARHTTPSASRATAGVHMDRALSVSRPRVGLVLAPEESTGDSPSPAPVYELGRAGTAVARSTEPAIAIFRADETNYQRWLRAHPDGYVLTASRAVSRPPMLHRAECAAVRLTTRGGSSTATRACATDTACLDAWSTGELGRGPGRCRRCRP